MVANDTNLNIRINKDVKAAAEKIIRSSEYMPSQIIKYYLYMMLQTGKRPKIGSITKPLDGTLNTRIGRELRDEARAFCDEKGTSLSEVCQHLYEYISINGELPDGLGKRQRQ